LGQKKYKYTYREQLKSQSSSFSVQTNDTLLENRNSFFNFQVMDKKESAVSFAMITVKSDALDTIIRSDIDG
jgi:hypothetical protein